jgi:glycosyltransferase involved in cell wall biosynthesis
MRIGIDARFLGPKGTGIGRYSQELVLELEKIDRKNEYVVFLKKDNFDLYQPSAPNFRKVLADVDWYTLKEQLTMPYVIKKEKIDLMHFLHFNVPIFYNKRFIVTIHDIIKSEFRGKEATTKNRFLYWIKYIGYEIVLFFAIKKALKVVVPSFAVKNKLKKKFKRIEGKIEVAWEGFSQDFKNKNTKEENLDVLKRLKIFKPYVLYVGNSYPYKNLDILIEAAKKIPNLRLVNPCARSIFYDKLEKRIQKEGLSDKVILTGFVSDEELKSLYQEAAVYVSPSFSEGFGIPILEAMAVGTPVVASNIESVREVGRDAVLYFNPRSADDLQKKIEKVLKDEIFKKEIIEKGKRNIERFGWDKMALKIKTIYERFS